MCRFFRPEYDYQASSACMMAMVISNHHLALLQEADNARSSFDGSYVSLQVRKKNSGQNSGHLFQRSNMDVGVLSQVGVSVYYSICHR